MGTFYATIASWIIGSNLARLFTGIGVAVVSQVFLTTMVNNGLASITGLFGTVSADIGNLMGLLGLGTYLSIIGSAFLTRVSVQQLSKTWAITSATNT